MQLRLIGQFGGLALALLIAACATKPLHAPVKTSPTPDNRPSDADVTVAPPMQASPPQELVFPATSPAASPPVPSPTHVSAAQHTDEYRRDAAKHIYQRLPERIYKGKLPPLLKAVVVVDIHIDTTGQVVVIDWVRVPKHSPDVTHDIEQAIRQSAPFPAPHYLKRVNFTETWLWHRSGRFQLNTLTEGQQ